MKSCHPMYLSTAHTVQSNQLAKRNQLGKTVNILNAVTKTIRNKKKGKTIIHYRLLGFRNVKVDYIKK